MVDYNAGKFVIVIPNKPGDGFWKDEAGKIKIFDSINEALDTAGIYELEYAYICKIEVTHIEK